MQNCFGLLVADMMPIYMIMPRYSHNYALFYQLLDSNLFTHSNTYAILREATSETYGPRSIFHLISFRSTSHKRDAIYMIIPIYCHNYSLFYQLLDSNLFTHRNTYAILREATSETYGPQVYSPSYKFQSIFTLQSLLSFYIIKIPKIFILLSLSHLTLVSDREGIDNPFIVLVARFLFVCVGTR